mmetsp:Transcript_33641/g.56524  ORF Transcript_33641/g.56524 Transcript_33641/m.56524 type:complete len:375 (-) Transcript_33641:47-1171(-)
MVLSRFPSVQFISTVWIESTQEPLRCWLRCFARWFCRCWGLRVAEPPPAGYPPALHSHAIENCADGVQGGADIKMHRHRLVRQRLGVIKVDHVAHFLSTSVDKPVMAIKWKFVPHPIEESRFRAEVFRPPLKSVQCGRSGLAGVQSLPSQNFVPAALIHYVVYGNHTWHVILARLPPFPLHSIVKHLLRRINPNWFGFRLVLRCEVAFGNRGGYAGCGEMHPLIRSRQLVWGEHVILRVEFCVAILNRARTSWRVLLRFACTRGCQPGEHGGGVGAGRGDRKFTPPPNVVRPYYRTFTWSHFVRGLEDRNQPNARSLRGRTLQSSPKSKVGLPRERWATSHVTQRSCTLGPGAIGQQRMLVFVLSTQNKVIFLK